MSKVIGAETFEPRSVERGVAGAEWRVLAWLGGVFVVLSLVDFGLAFYPLGFGSPEWEFGTATAVMNNFPLATVGVGLIGVAGLGRRHLGLVTTARALSVLAVVGILVLAVMFGRNVSQALGSVTEPVLREGLVEAIARTSIQLVAYLMGLGWFAVKLKQESDPE
jgi:hypothetical protein